MTFNWFFQRTGFHLEIRAAGGTSGVILFMPVLLMSWFFMPIPSRIFDDGIIFVLLRYSDNSESLVLADDLCRYISTQVSFTWSENKSARFFQSFLNIRRFLYLSFICIQSNREIIFEQGQCTLAKWNIHNFIDISACISLKWVLKMGTKAHRILSLILTAGNGHVPESPKIAIKKVHSDGALQESNLVLYTVMGNPNTRSITSMLTCKYLNEIVFLFLNFTACTYVRTCALAISLLILRHTWPFVEQFSLITAQEAESAVIIELLSHDVICVTLKT